MTRREQGMDLGIEFLRAVTSRDTDRLPGLILKLVGPPSKRNEKMLGALEALAAITAGICEFHESEMGFSVDIQIDKAIEALRAAPD